MQAHSSDTLLGTPLQTEFAVFTSREERIRYAATRFAGLIRGRVLDMGCDQAFLPDLVQGARSPDIDYTGIDRTGRPTLCLDLERLERLPFDDRHFSTSLLIDVLEHLDNLHHVLGETLRVTSGHVIISWPNCWSSARRPLERGCGSPGHYGLPPAVPEDRHKWFFSLSQVLEFLRTTDLGPFRVLECFAMEKPRPLLLRFWRSMLYPSRLCYLNRYAHSLWTVLERTDP